jgi:hypothetical protein
MSLSAARAGRRVERVQPQVQDDVAYTVNQQKVMQTRSSAPLACD